MDAELATTVRPRGLRLAVTILAVHAIACGAVAAACYLAPQALFGPAAALPLPAFAVALLGASLLAVTVLLVLSIVGGEGRQLRKALIGVLLLDIQVPVAFNFNPASLEYLERSTGIGWFWISILFPLFAGVIALLIARLRSSSEQA